MAIKFNEWFLKERYGVLPSSLQRYPDARFPKALLILIGADGEISEAEWTAFTETARLVGHSEESIAELKRFDWRNAKLEDYLPGIADPPSARRLIYDAVRVAHADGYNQKEREQVRRAAERLGIDALTLGAIESMVTAENALREVRRAWFTQGG